MWTESDLKAQYERVKAAGWLDYFEQSADAHDFDMEEVLAEGSRETNLTNIRGDYHDGRYHGFGILQVDVGTDPAFCASWTPDKVQESIERGTQILAAKRDALKAHGITDERCVYDAFNCGEGNVEKELARHLDPDCWTTGHDYGHDIVARRDVFAKFLDVDYPVDSQ